MKEIKKLLVPKTKSVVIQFTFVVFILSGLALGVILVQQNQNYREKAAYPTCAQAGGVCYKYECPSNTKPLQATCTTADSVCCEFSNTTCDYPGTCGGGCLSGQLCSSSKTCYAHPACNTKCASGLDCLPIFNSNTPADDKAIPCYKQIVNKQAMICCPSGYTIQNRRCVKSGGGTTPSEPPPGSTNPPPGGTTPPGGSCTGAKQNPGTFSVNKTGKLTIYYNVQGTQGKPFQIAVKPNSSSCSLTDNAGVFNLTDSATGKMETNLDVVSGQTVCFGVYYNQSSAAQYQESTSNTCGGSLDITPNVTQAESENGVGSISSKQCWANSLTECDFNDFAILFAVGGEGPAGGLSFKLRFQGITKLAADQKIDSTLLQNNSQVWSGDEIETTNEDTGAYTLTIPEAIQSGTYNLLVKGHSHLQKRFTNVVYNGGDQVIDLSNEENNQMRAGDVTDDNAITIEDVSQVLSFYDSFSVEVDASDPKMVASDVDKNGKITIQDVALIAINWSDFRVEGDI